ncbi:MAG: acyltransferase family protein [Acidimicrobiales bacterium]
MGGLNPPDSRARLDSLTGLRFVAAFAVFGFHLIQPQWAKQFSPIFHVFSAGPTGVSFFFILSGFVLTWSHRRGDTARAFIRRRLARIYPLHAATWALTGLLFVIYSGFPAKKGALASLFMLSSWIPDNHYYDAMNTPSWSLDCELFFYLLFPLLLAFFSGLTPRRRRTFLVGLLVLSLVVSVALAPATPGSLKYWALYKFPPTRLIEFVAGILLALELEERVLPRIPVGFALVVAAAAYVGAGYSPLAYAGVVVTFVPFLLLIASAAQADVSERRTVFSRRSFVRLGVWSFAFYLVHGPVIYFLYETWSTLPRSPLGASLFGALALGLSLATAAVASTFVEQPLERALRVPRGRRTRSTAETLAPETA